MVARRWGLFRDRSVFEIHRCARRGRGCSVSCDDTAGAALADTATALRRRVARICCLFPCYCLERFAWLGIIAVSGRSSRWWTLASNWTFLHPRWRGTVLPAMDLDFTRCMPLARGEGGVSRPPRLASHVACGAVGRRVRTGVAA